MNWYRVWCSKCSRVVGPISEYEKAEKKRKDHDRVYHGRVSTAAVEQI